jgi:hypothetical protein
MNVVLKDCHHSVFIEKRNPVEKSVEKPFWIFIKSFANTINRNVIVDKFDLIFVCLKSLPHKLFLESVEPVQVASIQDHVTDLSPPEMQKTFSVFHSRNPIHYFSSLISLELLGEVLEKCCCV